MGMEPEARDFLMRVMQTISMSLLWLLINMTAGIYFGLAFFDDKPSVWNCIFYVWFLISLGLLLRYFIKKWKASMSGD